MAIHLSFDRFEGEDRSIAVLVGDDGETINIPKAFLPADARPGDVLTLSLARDDDATRKLAEDTRKVQDELRATDPGGDIKL